MKRLCLILAYLFLFSQTASAMPLLVGQKVVYRGTVTGLRISAVDGTAFIDNLPLTYSSDFSAGVDGFIAFGGTVAGNIDSIGGEDNWLRLTSSSDNTEHFLYKNLFTKGKAYTITLKYYIPSTNSNLDGVKLSDGYTSSSLCNTIDTVSTASFTIVAARDTGFRVYAYDGTAQTFTDPGGDDVFYIKDIKISEIQPFMDGNHSIEIYDSSNRMLKGVLKAAGTSEGLGDELITDWTNRVSYEYDTLTVNANGHDVDSLISSGGVRVAFSNYLDKDRLYKIIYNLTLNSGSAPQINEHGATVVGPRIVIMQAGEHTVYWTLNGPYKLCLFNNNTATNASILFSVKQVTAPSSSGATIVSAKGGTTYNFSYKNDSFTYNEASYYVIIRAIR